MKNLCLTALLFLAATPCLLSQTLPSPTDLIVLQQPSVEVQIEESDLDDLDDAFDLLDANADMKLVVSMALSDTANVATIHVKLGTTAGGNDLGEHTFSFDAAGDDTYTYFREEFSVMMGMGHHVVLDDIFCEVYTQDASGNTSAVVVSTN
jgi:hypothetical protein